MPVSVLRCFGRRLGMGRVGDGMRKKEEHRQVRGKKGKEERRWRERKKGEGRGRRGEGAREEEREDRMGVWERRRERRELQRKILKILSEEE